MNVRKVLFWSVALITLPLVIAVVLLTKVVNLINDHFEMAMNTFTGWAYQNQDVAELINDSIRRK